MELKNSGLTQNQLNWITTEFKNWIMRTDSIELYSVKRGSDGRHVQYVAESWLDSDSRNVRQTHITFRLTVENEMKDVSQQIEEVDVVLPQTTTI